MIMQSLKDLGLPGGKVCLYSLHSVNHVLASLFNPSLLNPDMSYLMADSVDPDQLASSEAN